VDSQPEKIAPSLGACHGFGALKSGVFADMTSALDDLYHALTLRFADPPPPVEETSGTETLARMAGRGSQRKFTKAPVDGDLLRLLCSVALSSPTKSDLQQRDIVRVSDQGLRGAINGLLEDQSWVADAPEFLVFCGNNGRQRLIHTWRDRPFANDHLDAFFNAAVDAAIALAAFVTAAEAAGLGCCPVSAIRNRAQEVSDLLALPDHVFPVAGLAVGWPTEAPRISMRLPLSATLHEDRYDPGPLRETIDAYDRVRATAQPYETQRHSEEFGVAENYGWSEDKARQYAKPERADFGAFIRSKGFSLT
jgi:nitroreductase/FMN reductase [NAD(P)H]